MRLNPILTRLRGECPAFTEFQHAFAVNAIEDLETDLPRGFIHPVSEDSRPNDSLGGVIQPRRVSFAVLTAAITATDDAEPLEDARDEVFAALIGHQPDGGVTPIEHTRSELVDLNGRATWWRDTFSYFTL